MSLKILWFQCIFTFYRCSSRPDTYFISESDIDNSVTEKILRNKFFDPLISSDSEDDSKPKEKINWDEIFKKKKNVSDYEELHENWN